MSNQRTKLEFQKGVPEEVKGLLSMLVRAPQGTRSTGMKGNRQGPIQVPGFMTLQKLANDVAVNKNDAKNLFQILPDMELASSILISAILSPGDLQNINLLYKIRNFVIDDNLSGAVLRRIDQFFTDDYRIKTILPDMLHSILITAGSYPIAVLPQSTLDQAINSSDNIGFESLKTQLEPHVDSNGWYKPFGILAKQATKVVEKISFESFSNTSFEAHQATRDDYTVSLESFTEKANAYLNLRNSQLEQVGHDFKFGKLSMEGSAVEVNDNPELLKNPLLLEKLRQSRVQQVYASRGYGASMEARKRQSDKTDNKKMSLSDVEDKFYPSRKYANVPLMPLLTTAQTGTDNFGHPVVMNLPPESVLPVHIPGSPSQHVGYFILLDVNGNPLSVSFRDDYYSDIRASMGTGTNASSHLTTMTKRAMDGYSAWNDFDSDQLSQTYWDVLEQDFQNRLRSGFSSGDYEISHQSEIALMMFSRACAGKKTTALFVPAELLIYMAFDYNEYGLGRSLTEDAKTLGVIRSILLFATTIAAVKNATGTKVLTIGLDPEDEDPYGSVEMALNVYAETNREAFPISQTHPVDLINSLQAAGLNVVVEGHRAFPEVKMNLEPRDGTAKEVSDDLDDRLRKRHIQVFGLNPENMETVNNADYATQLVNNNLMLLKRVVHYQDKFEPFLTDFVRAYVLNSEILMKELTDLVDANRKYISKEFKEENKGGQEAVARAMVKQIILSLNVELPKPEDPRRAKLAAEFTEKKQQFTEAMEVFLDEALFDSSDENMQKSIEALPSAKANIIALQMRNWMRSVNYLPELMDLSTMSEEDTPALNLLEEVTAYQSGTQGVLLGYLEKALGGYKKRLERQERLKAQEAAAGKGTDGAGGMGDDMAAPVDDLAGDGLGGDDLTGDPLADDLSPDTPPGGEDGEPSADDETNSDAPEDPDAEDLSLTDDPENPDAEDDDLNLPKLP